MISIFNNQTPNFAALENNNKNKNVSFGIKKVAEMNSTTDNQLGRLYLTDKGIVLQGALIAENRDSLNLSLLFSGNSLKLMSGDTLIGNPVTLNLGSEALVLSEGSTFGTISVNGVDLRVNGLDSAANIFNAGVVGTHTIANDIYIDNDNSISLISNSVLELVGDDIQINSGGNSAVFIGLDPVNNLSTVYLGSENTSDNLVATKGYVDKFTPKVGEITDRPSIVGLPDGYMFLVTDVWSTISGTAQGQQQESGPLYYVNLTSSGGHPCWFDTHGNCFEDTLLPQRS